MMVAGGALELFGLALIVREIRDDRRRSKELLGRPFVTAVGIYVPRDELFEPTVHGRQEQAVEERLAALERDHLQLRDDLQATVRTLREDLDKTVGYAYDYTVESVLELDQEHRRLLVDALAGSTRRRYVGVGALLLGITVATAANVWSLFVSC
jgi:hypothetical protein